MQEMNLNRIDLNLLVVFEAIARARSVTVAAQRLSLSQPAVSHALARLRDLVGDSLFLRGRRGLVLTSRAQAMLDPVGGILASIGAVLAPSRFDPTRSTRVFRLGVSDYSSVAALPSVIRAVRSAAPGVTLHAVPFGSESLAQLEAGELDCSFWGGGQMREPFRSRELFRDRPVGLVCTTHPIAKVAKRRAPNLEEFLAFPHVKTTIESVGSDPIDVALASIGRVRRIAVTTPSHSANFALMRRTDLILCPGARLAEEAARLGFVTFELPIPIAFNPYALLWHRRTEADSADHWLRELIAAELTSSEQKKDAPLKPRGLARLNEMSLPLRSRF